MQMAIGLGNIVYFCKCCPARGSRQQQTVLFGCCNKKHSSWNPFPAGQDLIILSIMHPNNMRILFAIYIFLGMWFSSAAQHDHARDPVAPIDVHNRVFLQQLSDSLHLAYWPLRERSLEKARELGLPIDFITREGVRYSLQFIEDGLPFYNRTFNDIGAITTATNQVHPGGQMRLFLTGSDLTAGIWDGGMVDRNHHEFGGRVETVNIGSDFDSHATHVAGTIVAAGADSRARGMAYEAGLRSFNWNNDLSEMASEAAKGILISNHSYGISLGWAWIDGEWKWMGRADEDEDYRFGFYSHLSRATDLVAFNAPHYLIVWAAGNDRSDVGDGSKPRDGPYDTIGPEGVSKNVLTVGAVNGIANGYRRHQDVTRTAFSSWGPTDDGRVKPDLVTKGSQVYSTDVNNGYSVKGGTSMSAPMATGSLLLIQQLYHQLSGGNYLRAASLKGLAIHTTNRAGNSPGPDYEYGWGLLDVSKMADFLIYEADEKLLFTEDTLFSGQTIVYEFSTDGQEPLLATLSWTDPPGTPVSPQLNPETLMLVNDLDMRFIHEDSTVYYPWILNPDIPSMMPTTGDNFRDNVEKILVEKPKAGDYQLVITHKGNTLRGGHQAFSLFFQNGHIPQRDTYYYTGRNGQWHDPDNWSLSSGGEPAGAIPGKDDHVVFDIHSFNMPAERLTLEEDAACFSVTVSNRNMGRIDLNGHDLRIGATLIAEKEFVSADTEGRIVFDGNLKIGTISVEGQEEVVSDSLEIVFDNPEGAWHIARGLQAGSIILRSGRLSFNETDVSVRELIVEEGGAAALDLGQAVFRGVEQVALPDDMVRFSGEQATMVFGSDTLPAGENMRFAAGGVTLKRLVSHDTLHVTGTLSVAEMENHSQLTLDGELQAEALLFSTAAGFHLEDNSRLVVGSTFEGRGLPGQPVVLSGTGNQTGIAGTSSQIFCLDYLHVINLPASRLGAFNAGENSVVENAAGWFSLPCDEVIMADFEVVSPCVGSWTFFREQSTEGVALWDWHFGEFGTSELQNPVLSFNETGTFDVALTIEKEGLTHTASKQVTIIENHLPRPTLHVSGRTYIVDIEGVAYQWYLDGEPIENATSRTYDNSERVRGVFTALISDDRCNRVSKNEVVVSTAELIPESGEVLVYPNPATSQVTIQSEVAPDEVALFDLSGKLLIQMQPASTQTVIHTSQLMPGLYIIRVVSGQTVTMKKLQVIR